MGQASEPPPRHPFPVLILFPEEPAANEARTRPKWTSERHPRSTRVHVDPALANFFPPFLSFFPLFSLFFASTPATRPSSRFPRSLGEEVSSGAATGILKYRAGWAISSPRCIGTLFRGEQIDPSHRLAPKRPPTSVPDANSLLLDPRVDNLYSRSWIFLAKKTAAAPFQLRFNYGRSRVGI